MIEIRSQAERERARGKGAGRGRTRKTSCVLVILFVAIRTITRTPSDFSHTQKLARIHTRVVSALDQSGRRDRSRSRGEKNALFALEHL